MNLNLRERFLEMMSDFNTESGMTAYFDKRKLIHDMPKTFTELWIVAYFEVLVSVELDKGKLLIFTW